MIYGWDLGGAHVKLAVVDHNGRLQRAVQVPCELWLGPGPAGIGAARGGRRSRALRPCMPSP